MGRVVLTALWKNKSIGGKIYWKAILHKAICLPKGARIYVTWSGEAEGKTHYLSVSTCNLCRKYMDIKGDVCQACIDNPPKDEEDR